MSSRRPGMVVAASLIGWVLAAAAWGQDECGRSLSQHQIRHFGSQQGLPLDTVYSLVQDEAGFLWVGTEDGLARFDGRQFDRPDLEDVLDGVPEFARSLALTDEGDVLAGIDSAGLIEFDPADAESAGLIHGARNPVDQLRRLGGRIFMGVRGQGLVVIDTETHATTLHKEGHADTTIKSIAPRSRGGVWIGYDGEGIQWFDGEEFHTPDVSLPTPFVSSLHEDSEGRLWIGTRYGLFSWDGEQLTQHGDDQGLADSLHVVSLFEDRSGRLWVGTGGDGIARRCGDRFETLGQDGELGQANVNAILEDREGSVWVATGGEGLYQLLAGAAVPVTDKQGLPRYPILPIAQAADGAMWLGTFGGGVVRIEDGRVSVMDKSWGLSSNRVLSLAPDPDGGMWVGTRSGLNFIRDDEVTKLDGVADQLSDATISALFSEEDGLWIGSIEGLSFFGNGEVTDYRAASGEFAGYIHKIFRASDGRLWIATDGGHPYILTDGRLVEASFDRELPSNVVFDMIESEPGVLWLATNRGLARWDGDSLSMVDSRHGLPENRAFSILDDGLGSFWLSGNRGVFRASISALEDVALRRTDEIEVVRFDREDGMPRSETNGGFQPAAWRDRRGRLWYPTVDGAARFDPAEVQQSDTLPPPAVTGVASNNGGWSGNGDIRIPPRLDWINLSYSAPTFRRPDHVRYRYRLIGFDNNWFRTIDSSALFRKIPAGHYTFEVQARLAGGQWSDSRRQDFRIERHWLESPLYWALAVLVAGLGILLFVRAHLRRQRAHREQMQQAQKLEAVGLLAGGIAHDFNNLLTVIMSGTEILAERMPSGSVDREEAERVLLAAERGTGLTRQLLTFAGHQKVEPAWVDLAAEIRGMRDFLDRLLPSGIEVHWNLAEFAGYCHIDPVQFQQVVMNLAINARDAMSGRGTMFIALAFADRSDERELNAGSDVPCAVLSVRDTGRGMDKAVRQRIFEPFFTTKANTGGSGLGLAIVYSIVQEAQGWLEVQSEPGEGSTFHVLLPIRQDVEDKKS